MLSLFSASPEQTHRFGAQLAVYLAAGDVLALQGELGSGKTNFVQGLAAGLGIPVPVHSPTFILANEYRGGRLPLFHVDAYRVESAVEAFGFGFADYINSPGVTVVEWADRILEALPPEHLWIEFRHAGDSARELRMTARGERHEKLLDEFEKSALKPMP